MNSKLYRLVFSRSRGALVAAAENVAASGKSAAGEAAGAALALAGLALVAGPAFGQALPSNASIAQGAASVSVKGAAMVVKQTTPRLIADWQSFSIGAGNSVQFVQPSSASVALNRVTGNQASSILGSLSANGHVYLQNPAGVLFAPSAQVNVGALVATTLQADLNAFRAGQLRLSGGEASTGAVVNHGSITTPAGGHVVLAGPQVGNAGSISTPLGTTALAAGNAVNVDPTGSGLLSISVPVAALGAHLSNTGNLSADGGLVALQAAATDAALRSVMQVGGVVRARSIEQRDGQIVLAGGTSGVVAVTGTLDASGSAGADTRGGRIKVLGERVALLGNARLDASGDAGGGTVLVGGNYQGKGAEPNAVDTYVGGGATIDASARRSGDGGTAVVWADRGTDFKGRIDATGGRDGGNGGMAEVSGKQLLRFGGNVSLRAPRGKTGTLLLDPDTIDVGFVADIDGNGSTGDDIIDSVSPSGPNFYLVNYFDFSGAASRITASQVATLLFDNQVTLQANNSITISAPITVTPALSNRTLELSAPTVRVNAALDLGNSYLIIDTQQSFSDSIRINAPVRTNNVVNLTSSDIGLQAPIDANTIYLNAAPGAFSTINSTGGLRANYVIVTKDPESSSSVTLAGNNNIHWFLGDATNATVNVVRGDMNDGGFIIRETNVSGNFNVSVSGTSVYQIDGIGYGINVGGQFNLTLTDPLAVRPQVFLQNALNSFGSVVFDAPADFFLDGSAGPLNVRGTAGGNITLLNTNHVTSLTGDVTSTGATGNTTIQILGVGFDNSADAQLIVQPGSRFIVTSRDYTQDVLGAIGFGTGLADFNFVGFNLQTDPSGTLNTFSTNQNGTLVAPQSDLPAISRPYNRLATFGYTQSGTGTATFTDNLHEVAARVINEGPFAYTATGSGQFAGNNDNTAAEINKGYITDPTTITSFTGSSGTKYAGLTIQSYTRLPGPSSVNPISQITQLALTLSGIAAADKIYDANTVATITGTAVVNPLSGDTVSVTGTPSANFNNKNVGNAKPVTVSGYTLGGASAGNYTLGTLPTLFASITPATLAVTGIGALDKVYDATTVATLTGTGAVTALGSDVVTLGGGAGNFNNKNVGANKPVIVTGFTLGGADSSNYLIQQPTGVTASITPANLAISGLTAVTKAYDANTVATLIGSAVATPLGSDSVTLTGTGSGSFADKNAGVAKPVTVTGFTLSGPDAGNYLLGAPPGLVADITPINLAVTGISAIDKTYDANTVARLAGTPSVAPIGTDVVSAVGSGTGAFDDKNVGTAKPVTVSGYALTGTDAANYLIVQPNGLTASILRASLTISGISVADKVYDRTTVATLTGNPVAAPLGSDVVNITGGSGTASFADKNVGAGKLVTVTGYTLSGTDAGNYTLGQPTGLTASITPAPLSIGGFTVADKTYDGNTVATITGAASVTPLPGDVVFVGSGGTGAFADKNVGVGKSVVATGFVLTGADAGNYSIAALSPSSASITARPLAVTGIGAANKVYDATPFATLTGSPGIAALAGDAIALGGSGVGSFANKNVGIAKPVAVTGYALVGSDAGNYTLAQPALVTASISPASLSVSGISAADKVYDTTNVATLAGTPRVAALGTDVVGVSAGTSGSFSDKNVGLDKPVSLGSFTLTGADAGNYTLVAPTGLSADITPRVLAPTGISAVNRGADPNTTNVALDTSAAALPGVLVGDTVTLDASSAIGSVSSADAGRNKTVAVSGLALSGPDARNYALSVGANGLANSTPLVLGITVTLFSPLQQVFEDLRNKEYLQGVSDAQEPFRRAMAEALAAGFGKENIRKQLQRGLVFETGLAAPAVDTIEPARKPASCTPARGADASPLSCNP